MKIKDPILSTKLQVKYVTGKVGKKPKTYL